MSENINLLLARLGTIGHDGKEALRQELIIHINDLLNNNFSALVQLLYRIDVDEQKLTFLLSAHPDVDAAILISDLMISRQEEKVESRKLFKPGDPQDEEKW